MSKESRRRFAQLNEEAQRKQAQLVDSLLDAMEDGNEYGSIVAKTPRHPLDLVTEARRALAEIEVIRRRPCLCYIANVVKPSADAAITLLDHLPFAEMVAGVEAGAREVDILLVTPGGSAEQVIQFVDALRTRFDTVEFLLPYMAMSAGTLWALSGDRIWMDRRAYLGPIDPQVVSKDGNYVPAQALLALLNEIQQKGQEALKKGQQPPWSYIILLREMDQRQLGAAMTSSQYVVTLATKLLASYKFRSWTAHRSTGQPVTEDDRRQRAQEVATQLSSHEQWKIHGHAISRAVAETEVRLLIDFPESVPGLERAMRRLWALIRYGFDRAPIAKMLFSQKYSYVRGAAKTTP